MEAIVKPAKVELYINSSGTKSAAQVRDELGCDYVINGGLFNKYFKPVCHLKADGKVMATDEYKYWGYGWDDKGLRLMQDYGGVRNYICCVCMVRDGKPEEMYYNEDMGGRRQRTAMGLMPDGQLWLYASTKAMTPEQLRAWAITAGVDSAVMLDGGGSTQWASKESTYIPERKVHNYICVWEDTGEVSDPFSSREEGDGSGGLFDAGDASEPFSPRGENGSEPPREAPGDTPLCPPDPPSQAGHGRPSTDFTAGGGGCGPLGTPGGESGGAFKIALGAGHGIHTVKRCMKALDPNETREWVLNDRVCDRVEELLKAYEGYELLRLDDSDGGEEDIALAERVNAANAWGADFYLSVHHNAGINGGRGGGIVAFSYKDAGEAAGWRDELYEALIEHTGLRGNRAAPKATATFYVLRKTAMPAVLLELGFMDSATDVPIILSDDHADKCAQAIVEVLVRRGGLRPKPQTPERGGGNTAKMRKEYIN